MRQGEDELYKGSVNYKFFKTTILELRKRGIRFPSTIEETRRKKSSEAERIARRQGASSSTSKSSSSPVASSAQTRVLAKYTDKDCSTGAEIALLLVETLSASSPREDLQRNELVALSFRQTLDTKHHSHHLHRFTSLIVHVRLFLCVFCVLRSRS